MAARRYEKYFRSERSERVKCFHHKKRNFVSLRGHVLFCFKYYINTTQNTKPFYFFICIYIHFLAAKGAIYYVAIAKVIFSTANVVYVSGGEDNV